MGLNTLKVEQDVATRWNSCLLMIERLLAIKDSLYIATGSIPNAPKFLDFQERNVIKNYIPVLKPVEFITTILSGGKYPTMSMIIPVIRGLQYFIVNTGIEHEIADKLKTDLLDKISLHLGILEVNKTVAKASFLDPRYKKIGFGNEINASNAQKWVSEELTQIINKKNQLGQSVPIDGNEQQNSEKLYHAKTECGIWSLSDQKVSTLKIQLLLPL